MTEKNTLTRRSLLAVAAGLPIVSYTQAELAATFIQTQLPVFMARIAASQAVAAFPVAAAQVLLAAERIRRDPRVLMANAHQFRSRREGYTGTVTHYVAWRGFLPEVARMIEAKEHVASRAHFRMLVALNKFMCLCDPIANGNFEETAARLLQAERTEP